VEHLFEDLRAPVRTPVGRVRFSVSAGCAHVRAGSSLENAFDRAFAALNRAKADGGGTYVIDPA
jgi:predicted signal transduction protein with EAL and GGDEF domain